MGFGLALLGGGADGVAQALASFSQLALSRLLAGGAFGAVIGGAGACGSNSHTFFPYMFSIWAKSVGLSSACHLPTNAASCTPFGGSNGFAV